MVDAISLHTPRLLMRPWRDADRAAFAALSGDPRVMAYFPRPLTPRESDAQLAEMQAHFVEHGYGWWALQLRSGGSPIGYAGLQWCEFPAPFAPALSIGWRLATEYWGEGYAQEAAQAALTFAFEQLQVEEVVAFSVPANLSSLALMERLGMGYAARDDFEHPWLPPEHPLRHHLLYRLSRRQWKRGNHRVA